MNNRDKRAEIMTSDEYYKQNFKDVKEDKEKEEKENEAWLKRMLGNKYEER